MGGGLASFVVDDGDDPVGDVGSNFPIIIARNPALSEGTCVSTASGLPSEGGDTEAIGFTGGVSTTIGLGGGVATTGLG